MKRNNAQKKIKELEEQVIQLNSKIAELKQTEDLQKRTANLKRKVIENEGEEPLEKQPLKMFRTKSMNTRLQSVVTLSNLNNESPEEGDDEEHKASSKKQNNLEGKLEGNKKDKTGNGHAKDFKNTKKPDENDEADYNDEDEDEDENNYDEDEVYDEVHEEDDDEDEDEEEVDYYFRSRRRGWRKSLSTTSEGVTRKQRGLTQPIYLIEVQQTEEENERNYVVMGTTGNVYDVTISNHPRCTCPDFKKRKSRCKHIYFILLKIMKINPNNRQRKFSNNDLKSLFRNIPDFPSNLIADGLKAKYKSEISSEDKEKVLKMQSIDDCCPVCLEDLKDGTRLDYCKYSCGKSIHKKCFEMWSSKREAKCVFCRADWIQDDLPKSGSGEYINLLI